MKTALVTGANKGIGFEVARLLAEREFQMFMGVRNRSAGDQAAAKIKSAQAGPIVVELDVADPGSIARAARAVADQADHLDVLVNNAGIVATEDDLDLLTLRSETLLRLFTTNALGALRVTQAFHPLLAKARAPRIINVSSGIGQLADSGTWAPGYGISKTALNGVTAKLAAALKDRKFAVNAVCPGWCRTDMGGPTATRSAEQGADTIVWLATEAPQELTGQFLRDRQVIPW